MYGQETQQQTPQPAGAATALGDSVTETAGSGTEPGPTATSAAPPPATAAIQAAQAPSSAEVAPLVSHWADPGAATAAQSGQALKPVQLQPAPGPSPSRLIQELGDLIARGTWPAIRAAMYPKLSAPALKRAKDRRDPKNPKPPPDLTGIGSIKSIAHFASAVKSIQGQWGKLGKPDIKGRARALFDAANVELKAANVFPLKGFLLDSAMLARGSFSPRTWTMTFQEALIKNPALSDTDAAELCNLTLHEARHAEQQYLAARFQGSQPGQFAADVVNKQKIDGDAAIAAVQAEKLNQAPKLNADEQALAKKMFKSKVTDRDANNAISQQVDVEITALDKRNAEAQAKLAALKAVAIAATIAEATTARDALKAQIVKVEQAYTAYRSIPHEEDAHEAGDSAEMVFKGLP